MQRITLVLVFFFISLASYSQGKIRKAIFIIVDGIPADVVESVPTPAIHAIAARGKYLRAFVGGEKDTYTQTPTISAVGYNSLLTGTWANKHNVWDNQITAPNYSYKNIFRLLKEQYPQKKAAVFSSWTDNRTKLVGHNLSAAGNVQVDYYADGYELDTLHYPHDPAGNFMHNIDEKVTAEAASFISEKGPDLSWVYLEYTDDMGHRFGDSDQFYSAVEMMDKQVGRIWEAVQFREKNFKEQWLIIITTDHGRTEKDGKGHGAQSPRQRSTWLVTNQHQLNSYALNVKPAIVDIMPTIANFMNVRLTKEVLRELDGTSLIGPVSIVHPEFNIFQHKLDVSWKAADKKGKLRLWLTGTNDFKNGGEDSYKLIAEVPVTAEHLTADIQAYPSDFYKVVLEGQYNTINWWKQKE